MKIISTHLRWGLLALMALRVLAAPAAPGPFRGGAHAERIDPTNYPVLVNAMFTERSAARTIDPLHARALVLDDGTTRLALCVVDTCMMPRDLIDEAKELARAATGIPLDRMLISATHTHSAPSAMGCLGSREDTNYGRRFGLFNRVQVQHFVLPSPYVERNPHLASPGVMQNCPELLENPFMRGGGGGGAHLPDQ